MRREPPWAKRPDKSSAWTGVSGAIQTAEPPRTPPWGSVVEAGRALGGSVVYHEGTKVQLKVPVGQRRYTRESGYSQLETNGGVVDPDLIARFVTEEDRILMLVEAEVDARFQKQLDALKKRVDELEKALQTAESYIGRSSFFSGDW